MWAACRPAATLRRARVRKKMPELPEVETLKNDLAEVLVGKTIADVEVRLPKMVKSPYRSFRHGLKNRTISSLARRGKLLIIELNDGDQFILIHLKMTGQLVYKHGPRVLAGGHSQSSMLVDNLPNKYSHVIWHFADGAKLFFNDLRQFGYVKLVTAQEKEDELSLYGVEPLAAVFTPMVLTDRLKKRRVALKLVLLNQSVIAGLGNIYVDEACFLASVRPTRRSDRLTKNEILRLHRSIQRIIKTAIKHRGTTFSDYRDASGREGNFIRRLRVYGRVGESCVRCQKGIIKKVIVGGRGTAYCPQCQS